MSIKKTPHGIIITEDDNLTDQEKDHLFGAIEKYSFMLPSMGEFSFDELASKIKRTFSGENAAQSIKILLGASDKCNS